MNTSDKGSANEQTAVRKKPGLRERTLGTKVTEEEYAAFEAKAWENGKSVSDYARMILLAPHCAAPNFPLERLFAEVVAVRLLLLNLLPAFAKQELPGMEELREFIAQVDQEKLQIVRDQIRQWKEETEEQP
ncbi:MAG: hypothetical protein ACYCOR_19700 [Acidobacteriaceae bacterium]